MKKIIANEAKSAKAFKNVLARIYESYIAEFEKFSNTMKEKIRELEENPS